MVVISKLWKPGQLERPDTPRVELPPALQDAINVPYEIKYY
jgi:hypothetical protein